jgi:tryptophan-rich sensory protein
MNLKQTLTLYIPSLILWGLVLLVGMYTFPVWQLPFALLHMNTPISPALSLILGVIWIVALVLKVHAFRIIIVKNSPQREGRYWLLYLGHLIFFPAAFATAFFLNGPAISFLAMFYLIYLLMLIVLFYRQSHKLGLFMIPYTLWMGSIILYVWMVSAAMSNYVF